MVIECNKPFDFRFKFFDVIILLDIDLFILEGSEESLNCYIVYASSLAVHRDGDTVFFEHSDMLFSRIPAALIGVEYFGRTILRGRDFSRGFTVSLEQGL